MTDNGAHNINGNDPRERNDTFDADAPFDLDAPLDPVQCAMHGILCTLFEDDVANAGPG